MSLLVDEIDDVVEVGGEQFGTKSQKTIRARVADLVTGVEATEQTAAHSRRRPNHRYQRASRRGRVTKRINRHGIAHPAARAASTVAPTDFTKAKKNAGCPADCGWRSRLELKTKGTGRLRNLEGQAAFEALRTSVFAADADLNLVYMNPLAADTCRIRKRIKGGVRRQRRGTAGWLSTTAYRDPKRVSKILRRHAAARNQFTFGKITLRTHQLGVQDAQGNVISYIVNWDDVSDDKRRAEMARVNSMTENARQHHDDADLDLKIQLHEPASKTWRNARGPQSRPTP